MMICQILLTIGNLFSILKCLFRCFHLSRPAGLVLFCEVTSFGWFIMILVTLIFDAFTLFLWLHHWNVIWSHWFTFKSCTNTLVCVLCAVFLCCFLIKLFTFKQSWQGLCGESIRPNNVELLCYHTGYIHIWSHHVGLVCFYEIL